METTNNFSCNNEGVSPERHFGLLCLGLHYLWNEDKKLLELESLILPCVDPVEHVVVEAGLYHDLFRVPARDVTVRDGVHFARRHGGEWPILNYDMLRIPQTPEVAITESLWGEEKRLVVTDQMNGLHTVNRCCSVFCINFLDEYTELYGCMLDFDRRTESGTAVGFDSLGKIVRYNCATPIDELYGGVIGEPQRYSDEYYERCLELGFLNFSRGEAKGGGRRYEFSPVWSCGL